jgi:hypothetical protein
MKLEIERFLDRIDGWKRNVHEKLKGLSLEERLAFWRQIHEEARARGMNVVDAEEPEAPAKPVKMPSRRVRRNGKDTKTKRALHHAP